MVMDSWKKGPTNTVHFAIYPMLKYAADHNLLIIFFHNKSGIETQKVIFLNVRFALN